MPTSFKQGELDEMIPKLKEELLSLGGAYRLCVVYGRKPES